MDETQWFSCLDFIINKIWSTMNTISNKELGDLHIMFYFDAFFMPEYTASHIQVNICQGCVINQSLIFWDDHKQGKPTVLCLYST